MKLAVTRPAPAPPSSRRALADAEVRELRAQVRDLEEQVAHLTERLVKRGASMRMCIGKLRDVQRAMGNVESVFDLVEESER